jgi:hypothetical protein
MVDAALPSASTSPAAITTLAGWRDRHQRQPAGLPAPVESTAETPRREVMRLVERQPVWSASRRMELTERARKFREITWPFLSGHRQ